KRVRTIVALMVVSASPCACGGDDGAASAGGSGGATSSQGSAGAGPGGGAGHGGGGGSGTGGWDLAKPAAGEWPMFKRDAAHTGLVADMAGAIDDQNACVKWQLPVTGVRTRAGGGPVIGKIA